VTLGQGWPATRKINNLGTAVISGVRLPLELDAIGAYLQLESCCHSISHSHDAASFCPLAMAALVGVWLHLEALPLWLPGKSTAISGQGVCGLSPHGPGSRA
jgi:hypothetical protein